MTIPERDRRAAITSAMLAATRGLPATTCPYDPGGDPAQAALAVLWLRAYLRLLGRA
ncbi:Rmf/CrpP family protein [Nonomuraea sp. NPDC050540]|uniref:Rmf/CrpP family protein n=1 Tax=Nonomuraea sp. NPDC050540 TaxID=3364367 RepID=UPI003798E517